jgi:DNA-directed RNA polymerase sigma subunit (sigma70/sigma32)
MFYREIFKRGNHYNNEENHFSPHETECSKEFLNCMLLLDRPLTVKEVGEIYGVSFQTIARIEKHILKHVKKQLEKEV